MTFVQLIGEKMRQNGFIEINKKSPKNQVTSWTFWN